MRSKIEALIKFNEKHHIELCAQVNINLMNFEMQYNQLSRAPDSIKIHSFVENLHKFSIPISMMPNNIDEFNLRLADLQERSSWFEHEVVLNKQSKKIVDGHLIYSPVLFRSNVTEIRKKDFQQFNLIKQALGELRQVVLNQKTEKYQEKKAALLDLIDNQLDICDKSFYFFNSNKKLLLLKSDLIKSNSLSTLISHIKKIKTQKGGDIKETYLQAFLKIIENADSIDKLREIVEGKNMAANTAMYAISRNRGWNFRTATSKLLLDRFLNGAKDLIDKAMEPSTDQQPPKRNFN